MELALEAILGHRSAHSLATGPAQEIGLGSVIFGETEVWRWHLLVVSVKFVVHRKCPISNEMAIRPILPSIGSKERDFQSNLPSLVRVRRKV